MAQIACGSLPETGRRALMGFGCQSASSRYEAATISKRFPSLSRGRRDSAATRVLFKRSLRCTSHSYTHIWAGQTTQSIKASAVWFCSRDPHLWDLRNERWQPKLIKNPWANHPIPDELLPLPGYKLNDENEFESTIGTTFADILGLPEVWSPKEEPDCWSAICSYACGIWNRVGGFFK